MIGRALPLLAVALFVLTVGAVVASAGSTLGYDFAAFRDAGVHMLEGSPVYDPTAAIAGPQGLYLYPPPFAIAMIPFAVLPGDLATWVWIALMCATLLVAIALMPVRREVRWLLLLLAALDWPVLYSIKLGQVGPLIVLLFVCAWRWLDRPARVGLPAAIGTLIKLQPGLVLVWALLTRRGRAFLIALAAIASASILSILVLGPGSWSDYGSLLVRVSTPVTTPHLVTPGAILYSLGAPEGAAASVEALVVVLSLAALVGAALFGTPEQGLIVAATASQLASPVMWDHYAIVLLIPVAYLLERHVWAAALIPIATALPLVGITPPATYPLAFVVALGAMLLVPPLHLRWGRGAQRTPVLSSRP